MTSTEIFLRFFQDEMERLGVRVRLHDGRILAGPPDRVDDEFRWLLKEFAPEVKEWLAEVNR